MASLKINSLEYSGEKYSYKSPEFDNGLNILVGDNGTGKSTFCNLIYFALGGKIEAFDSKFKERHKEITSDTDALVKLNISINEKDFVLSRYIGVNEIAVADVEAGTTEVYQIYRVAAAYIFSDWMLEKVGVTPFSLFIGGSDFVFGWTDLLRLVYHDQNSSPKSMFKDADNNGLFKDSTLVKKVIFEVIAGKDHIDYYKQIETVKKTEAQLSAAQARKDLFLAANPDMVDLDKQVLAEIQRQLDIAEDEVEKLEEEKKKAQNQLEVDKGINTVLESLRESLSSKLTEKNWLKERSNELMSEMSSCAALFEQLNDEISQLKKIIHVNAQLSLFSPETCPCCLSTVQRGVNKCICGEDIPEEKYQRFFYSDSEYRTILKTKRKNLETLRDAFDDCKKEYAVVSEKLISVEVEIGKTKTEVEKVVDTQVTANEIAFFNKITDKLLEAHKKINTLTDTHAKVVEYLSTENLVASLKLKLQGQRATLKTKEGQAEEAIFDYSKDFSEIYNEMCTNTIKNCTSGSINEDYAPEFNEGLYLQASSQIGKRFCYFLTLLKLSLTKVDSKLPKFLLIDTPESRGISPEELNALITLIDKHFSDYEDKFQIILTTGINRYPDIFKDKIKSTMLQGDKLLLVNNPNP